MQRYKLYDLLVYSSVPQWDHTIHCFSFCFLISHIVGFYISKYDGCFSVTLICDVPMILFTPSHINWDLSCVWFFRNCKPNNHLWVLFSWFPKRFSCGILLLLLWSISFSVLILLFFIWTCGLNALHLFSFFHDKAMTFPLNMLLAMSCGFWCMLFLFSLFLTIHVACILISVWTKELLLLTSKYWYFCSN